MMSKAWNRSGMALLVGLVAACGDDATDAGDASSSSGAESSTPDDSSSGDPSATQPGPDSSGDDSSSDGSTDDTTTGGVPTGHARFIVRELIGVGALTDPVVRTYADGELSEPVTLFPDLPAGMGIIGPILPSTTEGIAAYCYSGEDVEGQGCFARNVADVPPGIEQPFNTGIVPSPAAMQVPEFVDELAAYVFRATAPNGAGESALYLTPLDRGALGSPRLLATLVENHQVSDDGEWVSYASAGNGFVVSTIDADPQPIQVNDTLAADESVSSVVMMLDAQALYYYVDRDDVPGGDALFLVDFSMGSPGAPVQVDDPLDSDQHRGFRGARDGHAFTYIAGTIDDARVMFVDVADGLPQTAVLLSPPDTGVVSLPSVEWSPDSRWVVYGASGPDDDVHYWLVPAAGHEPSTPLPLFEDGADKETAWVSFADETWIYASADLDAGAYDLYRIDISGDAPSEPERLNAPLAPGGSVWFFFAFSPDGQSFMYLADDGPATAHQVWLADVSNGAPRTAVRLNAELARDRHVEIANFSPDGALVTYREGGMGKGQMNDRMMLVDLSAPDVAIEISQDASGVIYLPE